jgi:hypothetical protein
MDALNKNASTRTRPVVYIASPYTKGDPAINTHFQCRVFNQLMDDGIVWPVVPLWTHFQHTVFPRKYQDWIDYDLALLDRYDACIRLDAVVPELDYKSTESSSADGEAAAFAAMGKPVFRSVEDCYAWVAARNQSPTQTPASERRTAGFSETGGCLVADLLTDDQRWAVLRAMNSLELEGVTASGPNDEELDNKAVSILCALVCQKQTSAAACAPHADKSSCRPDAPPDVTQPDNGLATSGRGPETPVEELPMQPNGNTAPAVDIVDKLADHTAVTMFDVDAAREEIVKLREAIRRLTEQDATLSVRNGAVTVTMDATLTDAERAAVEFFSVICFGSPERRRHADTLRNLLARLYNK